MSVLPEERTGKRAKSASRRRNRVIFEVLTDDNDYFKVIADARLKLDKDAVLAMPCFEKNESRGISSNCNFN